MTCRRDLRILLGLSLLALAMALVQSATGLSTGLLFMAPGLVLFLPLIAGRRYIGERRLAGLVRAPWRASVARALPRVPRPHWTRAVPRGGRLLAFSLAVRPPPAARIVP